MLLDINNFGPFNSDVWGTVSDYIVVFFTLLGLVVTALGTWYVVKSFRAQQAINVQQSELNRLAMEKDRREIRPYFKIDYHGTFTMDEILLAITLHNALAFEVLFEYATGGRYIVQHNVLLQSEWEIGASMQIKFKIDPDNSKSGSISIATIKFKDESSRAYSQSISYDGNNANISIPHLIENYSIWSLE